jgi:hypothetical protein
MLHSLLELGHATSQNLGFAHQADVYVSYGEETITETNLLELRRRHPTIVRFRTFDKKQESLNGADWEWHIIGRLRKFRMRIQAKRLQRDNKLKIAHKVKSSGQQQIDLLIADAKDYRLKPVYCFYSSEGQRDFWKKQKTAEGWEDFEAGCLLLSAHTLKAKTPAAWSDIEADCVPWHYLAERKHYETASIVGSFADDGMLQFLRVSEGIEQYRAREPGVQILDYFPTLDELNSEQRLDEEIEGIANFGSEEYQTKLSDGIYRDRGVTRLIEIDVRDFPPRPPRPERIPSSA